MNPDAIFRPRPSIRVHLKLAWGVLRRQFLHMARPGFVRLQLSRRLGACTRCGACCQLGRRCPHLQDDRGLSACRLYGRYRPPNCRNFPIDRRDLADRDCLAPHSPCGYSWPPE